VAGPELGLPPFVMAEQAARQEIRRRAYKQVQELTRRGLHLEADILWREAIVAADSQVAA
jgi:hypothetical protein